MIPVQCRAGALDGQTVEVEDSDVAAGFFKADRDRLTFTYRLLGANHTTGSGDRIACCSYAAPPAWEARKLPAKGEW